MRQKRFLIDIRINRVNKVVLWNHLEKTNEKKKQDICCAYIKGYMDWINFFLLTDFLSIHVIDVNVLGGKRTCQKKERIKVHSSRRRENPLILDLREFTCNAFFFLISFWFRMKMENKRGR